MRHINLLLFTVVIVTQVISANERKRGEFPTSRMVAATEIDSLLHKVGDREKEVIGTIKKLGRENGILTAYTPSDPRAQSPIIMDKRAVVTENLQIHSLFGSNGAEFRLNIPVSPHAQKASVTIYDLRGRVIGTPFQEMSVGGVYDITFATASGLGKGLYLAKLKVGSRLELSKFTVK